MQSKLNLKSNSKAYLLYAPSSFDRLLQYPSKLATIDLLSDNTDWLLAFYIDGRKLEIEFSRLKESIKPDGQIWISWPKKPSGVKTDLNDSVVRNIGLSNGLVDIKVASINDTWSGLKFVYRKNER